MVPLLFLQKLPCTSPSLNSYSEKKSHRKITDGFLFQWRCRLILNWKRNSSQFLSDEFCEVFQVSFFLKYIRADTSVSSIALPMFWHRRLFWKIFQKSSENYCYGVLFQWSCGLWRNWKKDFIIVSFWWIFG